MQSSLTENPGCSEPRRNYNESTNKPGSREVISAAFLNLTVGLAMPKPVIALSSSIQARDLEGDGFSDFKVSVNSASRYSISSSFSLVFNSDC